MPSQIISANYESMEGTASTARTQQGNLEEIIRAMVYAVDNLQLQGDAGNAIKDAWTGAKPTFVNFANLLGQYSTEVKQTAQDLQAADMAAAGRIMATCTL